MDAKIKTTDLLLWRKVIHNVEELPDLFRCLTLNHVSHSLESNITEHRMLRQFDILRAIDSQQRLDIKVIGSENDLKEHLLIDGDELLVPLRDFSSPLPVIVVGRIGIVRGKRIAAVMVAVFKHLDAGRGLIPGERRFDPAVDPAPSSRH